jgi:hypothetical protein
VLGRRLNLGGVPWRGGEPPDGKLNFSGVFRPYHGVSLSLGSSKIMNSMQCFIFFNRGTMVRR